MYYFCGVILKCAPALLVEGRGAWGTIVHEERLG